MARFGLIVRPVSAFATAGARRFEESIDLPKAVTPLRRFAIHRNSMYYAGMKIMKDLVAASATPLILSILREKDSYGYAIIQRVHELSNGEVEWTDGMLYPVLHRLEAQGCIIARWVTSDGGRKRKYYSLNPAGRKLLKEQQVQWRTVQGMLEQLWGAKHGRG